MAKKKVASQQKKKVPLKSVTIAEQNPAATDVEALKRSLVKTSRKKKKS